MTRRGRAVSVTVMLVMMLFTATGVAAAHAVLVGTDPEKDAALGTGPDRVSATFNEAVQDTFAAMTVVGPDNHLWHQGPPQVQGPVVSVAVRPLGPVGTYTVHYRVTSADGHPVSGSWRFDLTKPGSGEPGPAVSEPKPTDDAGDTVPLWPFAVGVIVAVGAGLWMTRRR